MMLLITSHKRPHARDAIARLRREVSRLPLIVLTEPGRTPAPGDAPALADSGAGTWHWRDGVGWPAPPSGTRLGVRDSHTLAPKQAEAGAPGSAPLAAAPRRGGHPSANSQLTLDPDGETLRCGDRVAGLSQAEARLFARLWESRGQIVSVEALMVAIYAGAARPASRVLPVFLFKLRKKLATLGIYDLIETSVGRGFMIPSDPVIEAVPEMRRHV